MTARRAKYVWRFSPLQILVHCGSQSSASVSRQQVAAQKSAGTTSTRLERNARRLERYMIEILAGAPCLRCALSGQVYDVYARPIEYLYERPAGTFETVTSLSAGHTAHTVAVFPGHISRSPCRQRLHGESALHVSRSIRDLPQDIEEPSPTCDAGLPISCSTTLFACATVRLGR